MGIFLSSKALIFKSIGIPTFFLCYSLDTIPIFCIDMANIGSAITLF